MSNEYLMEQAASPVTNKIQEEADRWLKKLQAADCTAEDRAAFDAWCAADFAHEEAFAMAERLDGQLKLLLHRPEIRQLREEVRKRTEAPLSLRRWFYYRLPWHYLSRSVQLFWAGISAAAVTATMLLVLLPLLQTSYETEVGQLLTITLEDGSEVVLDTDSRIKVSFDQQQRKIKLLRGQAFFSVTKDPHRPFRVLVDGGSVTAVGTAFGVRKVGKSALKVTLAEGVVEVLATPMDPKTQTPLLETLQPGEQLSYSPHSGLERSTVANLDDALSWKKGQLVFHEQRLDEVIAEVNRYLNHSIKLMDNTIAAKRIDAVFQVGDEQTFISMLQLAFDLQVMHRVNGDIELSRHKNKK